MKPSGGKRIFVVTRQATAEVRMYTCKDAINLLLDYLDGEMSPEDVQHLREHLSGCAPCIDFLRTYKATPGLCRRALAQQMPQEVSAKLTDYLRARIKSAS